MYVKKVRTKGEMHCIKKFSSFKEVHVKKNVLKCE